MRSPEETMYCIALKDIPHVGPVIARNLISYCGSPEGVFRERKQRLMKVPGVGLSIVANILDHTRLKAAEKEMSYVERNGIDVHFYLDDTYPQRLKHISQAPILVYSRGNMDLNSSRTIAIVGTRQPSTHGLVTCSRLINEIAEYRPVIISGLAYGIDISAHRESLKCELSTIAVLGSGMERIYPSQHRGTAKRMESNGGVLTEFSHSVGPDRENFPARNRIVAGLADIVVVVESAPSGGSMITAEFANVFNRDVGAVPGRVSDDRSKGCNDLIKNHKAHLIADAADIGHLMQWDVESRDGIVQRSLFADLSENETLLAELIRPSEAAQIDDLTLRSKMSSSQLAAVLLSLEFKGVVKALPGNRYVRLY